MGGNTTHLLLDADGTAEAPPIGMRLHAEPRGRMAHVNDKLRRLTMAAVGRSWISGSD